MMTTSRIRGCRSGTGSAGAAGTTGGTAHRAAQLGAPLPGAARWCPGGPARTRVVTAARGAATKQPDTTRTAGTSQQPRGYGDRSPVGGYEPERVPAARRGGRYPEAGAAAGRPGPRRRDGRHGLRHGPGRRALRHRPRRRGRPHRHAGASADPDLADSDVFPRVRADIPRPASKAGKQRNQPKSRGKASRKHDDDEDDWPSTEWDKLSDVEYWAELSADKPLATTARTAQPSAPAKPAADTARGGVRAARGAAAPVDYPDGTVGGGRRRPRAASHRPARPPSTRPPADREPGPQRPAGQPASAQRTDPRAVDPAERLGARREQPDVTERIPVRDRQRRPATPPPYADDDPLTSPSFSRASAPAEDSRSYRAAGRGQARSSNGSAPAGGYPRPPGSGGYPSSPAEPDGYPAPASGRRDYPAGAHRRWLPRPRRPDRPPWRPDRPARRRGPPPADRPGIAGAGPRSGPASRRRQQPVRQLRGQRPAVPPGQPRPGQQRPGQHWAGQHRAPVPTHPATGQRKLPRIRDRPVYRVPRPLRATLRWVPVSRGRPEQAPAGTPPHPLPGPAAVR